MTKVIAFIMLSPILFYTFFQPGIDRTIQYRDQVLQKYAYEQAHLVSLEGRLTPAIQAHIKNKLANLYFDTSLLEITGPVTAVERGGLVTTTLRYPQGQTQIFNLFGSAPSRDYYYPVTIMSEHIATEGSP